MHACACTSREGERGRERRSRLLPQHRAPHRAEGRVPHGLPMVLDLSTLRSRP